MSGLSRSVLMAALMAGLTSPVALFQPAQVVTAPQPRRQKQRQAGGEGVDGVRFGYRSGPGWTFAHVKRMAKKARNQRRHKLACRRARHGKQ